MEWKGEGDGEGGGESGNMSARGCGVGMGEEVRGGVGIFVCVGGCGAFWEAGGESKSKRCGDQILLMGKGY